MHYTRQIQYSQFPIHNLRSQYKLLPLLQIQKEYSWDNNAQMKWGVAKAEHCRNVFVFKSQAKNKIEQTI